MIFVRAKSLTLKNSPSTSIGGHFKKSQRSKARHFILVKKGWCPNKECRVLPQNVVNFLILTFGGIEPRTL
jgi:hypothetical protein